MLLLSDLSGFSLSAMSVLVHLSNVLGKSQLRKGTDFIFIFYFLVDDITIDDPVLLLDFKF